jgi:ATP-dependent Clp protease ATP-binding subunit ClpC
MTERFTARSLRVLELANEVATEWGDRHVGTEHLLTALEREENGIAATVLRKMTFGYGEGGVAAEVKRFMRR